MTGRVRAQPSAGAVVQRGMCASRRIAARVVVVLALLVGVMAGLGTAAIAATGAPAVATGRGHHGRDRWRLEGRGLTVRLGRPLLRAPGVPVHIDVVCGERALPVGEYGHLIPPVLADSGRARLRASRQARVLHAGLDRDLAARTTWCELRWRARGDGSGWRGAAMRPRGGVPTRCTPGRRETVALDAPRVLVTRMRAGSPEDGVMAYRACLRPGSRPLPLDSAFWGGGGGGASEQLSRFAADGARLAWVHQLFPHDGSSGPLRIRLRDLRRTHAAPATFDAVAGDSDPYATVEELAIGPHGAVGWIVTRWLGRGASDPRIEIAELNTRARDGRIVTLDAGMPRSLAALAILPDGTVTWHHDGDPRSAAHGS
jgi:hypothetical protein